MKEKYAKEILVPRHNQQVGGGVDDSIEQYWKRRLLVDELANAPHVDRVMIMDDMCRKVEVVPYLPPFPITRQEAATTFVLNASYNNFNLSMSPPPLATGVWENDVVLRKRPRANVWG